MIVPAGRMERMPEPLAVRLRGAGVLTSLVGLCILLLVACGSGGARPQAQPSPGDSVFRGGDFDQLPRYPRSEMLNQPTKKDAVVAETFSVSNTNAQQVLQYYGDHLVGWTATVPVESIGPDAYRGAWTKGGRELLVSGSRAPTLSQNQPVVQYSLELGPIRPVP